MDNGQMSGRGALSSRVFCPSYSSQPPLKYRATWVAYVDLQLYSIIKGDW